MKETYGIRRRWAFLLAAWCAMMAAAAVAAPQAPRVVPNVPYVAGGTSKQQVDLTLPAQARFPVVVFVHGGSLNSGGRDEPAYVQMGSAFAAAGIGFVSAGYRLFPDVQWPVPAQDVAAAVAWTRAHIAAYGGDADRIFLMGHSSGARLVELLAADARYLAAHDLRPDQLVGVIGMGSITHDVEFESQAARVAPERVRAAFESDPGLRMFGSEAVYRDSWALAHVNGAMPPVLILVAEEEKEQPPCWATAQEFAARAHAAGVWCRVDLLSGETHYGTVEHMSRPGDATFERIVKFVANPPTRLEKR